MTLLMSTGLTFGTISALFGLTNNIIDRTQYTILVTVVLGSAVVPTMIAQTWFRPDGKEVQEVARPENLITVGSAVLPVVDNLTDADNINSGGE